MICSAVAPDTGENKRLQTKHIYPIGSSCDSMLKIRDVSQLWKDYNPEKETTISEQETETLNYSQNAAGHLDQPDKVIDTDDDILRDIENDEQAESQEVAYYDVDEITGHRVGKNRSPFL